MTDSAYISYIDIIDMSSPASWDVSSPINWDSDSALVAVAPVRQPLQSIRQSDTPRTNSVAASDSAIGHEDGVEINAANAHEWLYYNPQYRVLVCRHHQYAVRNLATHLRLEHRVRRKERLLIEGAFRACELVDPMHVSVPPPLENPLDWLGTPVRGYCCDKSGCSKITVSRDEIRKHCNKAHAWKSTADKPEHWHGVYVQTMFQWKAHRRYFVVDYHEDDHENDYEERMEDRREGSISLSPQSQKIVEQWDQQLEKQEQALQLAEARVAKTDHTLWFKRNKWPEHLRERNLRHLSRACAMPRRDEDVLKEVPKTIERIIEECVKGLPTLGHVIRRWLRSAKASEPDVRPLARLQNGESQQRYTTYMTRFVCYTLRVWASCEAVREGHDGTGRNEGEEHEEDQEEGQEEEGEEGTDDWGEGVEDATPSSPTRGSQESEIVGLDTMKDARALYPWPQGLREIVGQLWKALSEDGSGEGLVVTFFKHVLFQHIRVNVFESPLVHFLAVLGINEDTYRLREANDYSYMLAGIVYCSRVLAVEIILPKASRVMETQDDDERFLTMRLKYLADGSFSPMAEMISLLAYSRHCAFNHANAGAISWSPDDRIIAYRGQKIPLAQFRQLVDKVVTEAEGILWRELLWQSESGRFELDADKLEDDVTFTRRGHSFLRHTRNGLADTRAWVLAQMEAHPDGRKLRQGERWHRRRVRKYLRRVDHFRELLLLGVHWTGGQPARGTEITSIRFRNGYMQDRNVFAIHGHMAVVTRYHKGASQFDQPKVVPRFLAWRVGQLLAIYLAYAQPLQELLAGAVNGQEASEYVWSGECGPWETDRLTRIMKRETGRHLGVELTTHGYRHVAIAIGRKVIGEKFANGYRGDVDGAEEPEEETDDGLEMQAGRGGEVGAKRYGVSMDIIKNLSSRSIDTFRPLCQQWHQFLGLESSRTAQSTKRKRVADEPDTDVLAAFKRLRREWTAKGLLHNTSPGQLTDAVQEIDPVQDVSPVQEVDPVQIINPVQVVDANALRIAMQKALGTDNATFRSETQRDALETIVNGGRRPLVVVMPTGGGKSLLFTAPACLDDAGTTIVVVPFRALINDLVDKAEKAGIDSIEWRPGEVNPATLVFVSADFVDASGLIGYAERLLDSGRLRRIFIDECHLIFKDSHWRAKLAALSRLRGINCLLVLLTATLPPQMQRELEYCMGMELCRYIRADTTRLRTRYLVEECKLGKLEERAIEICASWKGAHRSSKGVVYCRSKAQCETLADQLGCVYYHADADGKEERMAYWVEHGGLIVATSALGTGVDFPGITLILHVDIPWGMIDFTQESGRAGRQGEDVDSVIVVEKGRVERMRHTMIATDEHAMLEFIRTAGCRRSIASCFLDGIERDCVTDERGLAHCDSCGEGWTVLQRRQRQTSEARATVERVFSKLVDDCPVCWVDGQESCREQWDTRVDESCGEWKVGKCPVWKRYGVVTTLKVRFDADTHSCFRCRLSQKFCNTGQSTDAACQWPDVASPMLQTIRWTRRGIDILQQWGLLNEVGETEDEMEGGRAYYVWLRRRHSRRVLQEVVSNGFALLVEFILQQSQEMKDRMEGLEGSPRRWWDGGAPLDGSIVRDGDVDIDGDRDGDSNRGDSDLGVLLGPEQERRQRASPGADRRARGIVGQWEHGCIVCRANGRGRQDHAWMDCRIDADNTEAVGQGIRLMNTVQAPFRSHGFRCWANNEECQCRVEQKYGGCSAGSIISRAVGALVFGGSAAVRRWVEEQEEFVRSIGEGSDARGALEVVLSKKRMYQGQKQAGVDEFLTRWSM